VLIYYKPRPTPDRALVEVRAGTRMTKPLLSKPSRRSTKGSRKRSLAVEKHLKSAPKPAPLAVTGLDANVTCSKNGNAKGRARPPQTPPLSSICANGELKCSPRSHHKSRFLEVMNKCDLVEPFSADLSNHEHINATTVSALTVILNRAVHENNLGSMHFCNTGVVD